MKELHALTDLLQFCIFIATYDMQLLSSVNSSSTPIFELLSSSWCRCALLFVLSTCHPLIRYLSFLRPATWSVGQPLRCMSSCLNITTQRSPLRGFNFKGSVPRLRPSTPVVWIRTRCGPTWNAWRMNGVWINYTLDGQVITLSPHIGLSEL